MQNDTMKKLTINLREVRQVIRASRRRNSIRLAKAFSLTAVSPIEMEKYFKEDTDIIQLWGEAMERLCSIVSGIYSEPEHPSDRLVATDIHNRKITYTGQDVNGEKVPPWYLMDKDKDDYAENIIREYQKLDTPCYIISMDDVDELNTKSGILKLKKGAKAYYIGPKDDQNPTTHENEGQS